MNEQELNKLLEHLVKLPKETEWVEFKLNFHSAEEIGERISALANGASLFNQENGYLVFGVENKLQTIEGTSFKPLTYKVKGQELENWLHQFLNPRIDFRIFEFKYKTPSEDKQIAIFEIPAAGTQPVKYDKVGYIRVGSYTRKLTDFPEKEAKIWNKKTHKLYETEYAKRNISADEVIRLLDTQSFFDLLKLPYPTNRASVLEKLESEKFVKSIAGKYHITNLGGLLISKNINEFDQLARKAVRVIVYKGKNRVFTIREQIGIKGYAVGFEGLINYINGQLPANEEKSTPKQSCIHLRN